ncbi:iron complex outermembrane receptor protein [Sphingomonas jejuensis]|uniref:Iron complex outermembrane receptor protein n=1 Tax=Sphingomonas jejuensis TaxID=904715 RepID=A0ABX0XM76_9SPHN|nr:TonB-dependent receptor [Sphingomonas jejuensis]NJC34488.1 iron complex outermembrane receptor protein [Sphingomonas jejuensis]
MFRSIKTASLLAVTTSTAALAQVAPLPEAAPADSEEIIITGSNIRRSAAEGFNPVQVLGQEELRTSGRITVADAIRSISANTGNAANETSNSGWASGSAGIGLRGLSQKNTLVLLNGRRLANYGFPANGLSDTFVNLNALPLVAVQRIEVLKDGASAVYGSDAVAGVVNIITRQNFDQLELGGSFGTSGEGGLDTWRGQLVGGVGDIDTDGWNVLFSLETYQRDRLDQDQRRLTRSGIYSDLPGGRWNGWSARGARFLINGESVPFLDPQGNCPQGMERVASAPIDGLRGDTCAINLAPYTTLIPSTERYQAFTRATARLDDTTEVFAEALYSHITGISIFGSSPYFTLEGGRFALSPTTGLAEPVSNLLPANNPYNPYGRPVQIEYTFFDLGQSLKTNISEAFRLLGGVRGELGGFEWEAAIYASGSTERERVAAGFANRFPLAASLADGSLNLWEPNATNPAVLDAIRLSTLRRARSRLYGADLKIAGKLFDLLGGPVDFAAGVESRRESLVSLNPPEIDQGLQVRPAIAAVDGERSVIAAYAEVNVPIVRGLEVQLAARGDHYSDFGDAFSPKAGVRWQAFDWLILRGSASRGFRAPSLSENSSSTNISYGSVIDPFDPDVPNSRQSPTFFTIGNTQLEPERTRSYNLGAVFTPTRTTTLSVDWYNLKLTNLIGTNNTTVLVAGNDPANVARDARGKLVAVYNRYQNLSELETSGIDIDLLQRVPTDRFGEFRLSSVFTHVFNYRRPNTVGGPLLDYAGSNLGPTLPRNKATTRLGWSLDRTEAAVTWFHTGGYRQATVVGGQERVDGYDQFDIYLGYRLTDGITLYGKVDNVLDEWPPHDASFPGIRAPYDFIQYDLRGRYFQVGFDARF